MIELDLVSRLLVEADGLVTDLNGHGLNDADDDQSPGGVRRARAQRWQDLQVLANRLELAAQLVRVEYWNTRGRTDPLRPDRKGDDG